jgi:putative membrane protein insertion efficiency factor
MSVIHPRKIAIKTIHAYRFILSPWIGNQCRFYPTCSHYAEDAINTYGLVKGAYLTIGRLLKCHPWHPGGLDPLIKTNKSDINSFHQHQNGSQ